MTLFVCIPFVACDEEIPEGSGKDIDVEYVPENTISLDPEETHTRISVSWMDYVRIDDATYIGDWGDTTVDPSRIGECIGEIAHNPKHFYDSQAEYEADGKFNYSASYRSVGAEIYLIKDDPEVIAVLEGGKYYLYSKQESSADATVTEDESVQAHMKIDWADFIRIESGIYYRDEDGKTVNESMIGELIAETEHQLSSGMTEGEYEKSKELINAAPFVPLGSKIYEVRDSIHEIAVYFNGKYFVYNNYREYGIESLQRIGGHLIEDAGDGGVVVNSCEELRELLGVSDLSEKEYLKKYDDDFFKASTLIIMQYTGTNGGGSFELSSVSNNGEKINVYGGWFFVAEPGMMYTCDMHYVTFLIGLEKTDVTVVTPQMDPKALDKSRVMLYCIEKKYKSYIEVAPTDSPKALLFTSYDKLIGHFGEELVNSDEMLQYYDENYFKNKNLMIAAFYAGTTAPQYEIADVKIDEGVLTVHANAYNLTGIGSCIEVPWTFFIDIKKTDELPVSVVFDIREN